MATTLPPLLADSTLNINTLRAPLASSHAPSMADSLPSTINFGFDNLRTHMASFTSRFDEFIERGRRRVLEERNAYRGRVGEMNEQQSTTHRSLSHLSTQTTHHNSLLTSQTTETTEMHTAITSLTKTRDAHAAHITTLQTRLRAQKAALARSKATQRERSDFMTRQQALDGEELRFWEEGLGLRIEGTGGEDRVRFVFVLGGSGGGERERTREAMFELDMSGGRYNVVAARPALDGRGERVAELCRGMSDGEDLGAFLKGMRGLLVEVGEER